MKCRKESVSLYKPFFSAYRYSGYSERNNTVKKFSKFAGFVHYWLIMAL